jgi:hypothetical protein
MEYIKFNCHDLAAQSIELLSAFNRFQRLSSDLANVIESLDPQMSSYDGVQREITSSQAAMADISARILAAHSALDQASDIYYAAEKRALQASEGLPAGIPLRSSLGEANVAPSLSTSRIISGDLVLEDWLAELVYRYGSDENTV